MLLIDNFSSTITPNDSGSAPRGSGSSLYERYPEIGHTLLVCESVGFKVGVPWLPPTSRVRRLQNEAANELLPDFIRRSFVGIKTKDLESYCEDLESINEERLRGRELHIELSSLFERYAICGLAFIFFLLLLIAPCLSLGFGPILSLVVALLSAVPTTGLIAVTACGEAHRRATFYWLVYSEVQRRKGIDDLDPKNKLRIFAIGPDPVAE